MQKITLQVLQGSDRGKTFTEVAMPMTIGREEGNAVQLNDERISRFHVKIQIDNDHLVLTDLDSTNGTQVNGLDCQLRILRIGDVISVGRSALLVGSREQIADRVESMTATGDSPNASNQDDGDFEMSSDAEVNYAVKQIRSARDEFVVPSKLTPCQSAQLSELLENINHRLTTIIGQTKVIDEVPTVEINTVHWQLMLDLTANLATLVRTIADPNES